MNSERVRAVAAHARLREGNFAPSHRMAMRRTSPYQHFPKSSPSFYDSVKAVERAMAECGAEQKSRLLTLTQLTDLVVPVETMTIPGARSHRSIAFGHSGGALAHLTADRDIVREFRADGMAADIES